MKKHDNLPNHFNAKFDAVQAADRFVESIEDQQRLWTNVDKEIGADNTLFEAFGQIDLWDGSVDAWHTKFELETIDDDLEDDDDFIWDDDDWDFDEFEDEDFDAFMPDDD